MVHQSYIHWLKRRTNFLFEKPAQILGDLGVHPHVLTSIALISGLLSFYFLFENHVLFVFFGALHLLFDVFDGYVARYRNMETKFGDYFDHLGDKLIEFLLLGKFIFFFAPWLWWVLLVSFVNTAWYYLYDLNFSFYLRTGTMVWLMFNAYLFVGFTVASLIILAGSFFQIYFLMQNCRICKA